jgi:SagB-type dehydrogenase family enzyme
MKRATAIVVLVATLFLICGTALVVPVSSQGTKIVDLPQPTLKGTMTVEETLARRRSVRSFTPEPLTVEELGQLVWAAQGITESSTGHRTAPSAGALYPIELYVVTSDGVYHYVPQGHKLRLLNETDLREAVARAAGGQSSVREAAADFVVTAVYARTAAKYREHWKKYVHIEVGHVGQNIHLQAVALGLGSVSVGAFNEERLKSVLSLPADHEPLYIIPVGHPAT